MNSVEPRIAFLFTNSKDKTIADIRTGQDADTPLHGLNHIPGAGYFVIHPTSVKGLWFVPRLLRYDFVLTQDHLLLGFVVSLCARLFRFKTKWLHFSITGSTLIKRHAAHPLRLFLFKTFWNSYARIICITSEQRKDFLELGVSEERLVFIPFPIDASFFVPGGVPEESFVVSVGRDAGRDYPTLVRAAAYTRMKIAIVCAKRNIPDGLSIPKNVSVLYDRGLLEVRDLYARSQFVVVVSKDIGVPDGSDCSGQTVILEALAAGKAVIATDRPWITDYLVPGDDLIVVPPNDPEAIARAIDSLSRDAEKRKRLVASGRAKVLERYTTKVFTKSLLSLMDSLA